MFAAAALFPLTAGAAEVTDMPGELQGIVGVTYGGSHEWGALVEGDEVVSQRRVARHDVNYRLQFAPVTGVAVVLDLAHTPSVQYNYPNARTMLLEPVDGGGTYLLGDPDTDTARVSGGGLVGMWLGVALSPFSEQYQASQRATWRIDAAVRTASPRRNLWTAPEGKRGAAPGGTAFKLQGAFSADLGVGNPWMQATFIKENPVSVDVTDEQGQTWATDLQLRPASSLDFTTGVEIVGIDDREAGTRFAVDLFLGVGYRSWEDVASGVYLPNVLEPARGIPVTAGELLQARAGLAFDYHVNQYVRARTGPDVRIHTPFRPEHAYAVRTRDENLAVGWMFRLEGVLDGKAISQPRY